MLNKFLVVKPIGVDKAWQLQILWYYFYPQVC